MKMEFIFEVTDKTRRKIRLTKRQWNHIMKKHPRLANYKDDIVNALKNPLKITGYKFEEDIHYYYKYLKHNISSEKYLLIVVKYLNGTGFVISAFFVRNIK